MADLKKAWIGLGANLGDRFDTLAQVVSVFKQHAEIQLLKGSSFYRSAPVDATGPDYINAVISVHTALAPKALLHELQKIEHSFGRTRPYRNAPRTLDIDILLYEGVETSDEELTLPHPRMHERAFVLQPLFEIAPELVIPHHGAIKGLLAAVSDQAIVRLADEGL